jgi:predicted GNAT family acetyltransferase
MGLQDRTTALAADAGAAVMLTDKDIHALERLYTEAYPGNWFDARMVQTGCYAGIWHGDALVAAAGIHVVSEREQVAALGNVTSHPAVRGQGYARQVCARLLRHLDGIGIAHIGLNVAADNVRAQQVYAGLGFVPVAEYHEVMWG